jgi:predicted enzyme related to lactoylglutathione lyase
LDRTISHFEIPANDPAKLGDFYTRLFGWKLQEVPGMGYWMVETKAKQEAPGINAGIMKKQDASQRPVNYVSVESVDEFSKRIQQLGGRIVMPKQEVPGWGFVAQALDPEGNVFGLWQATQR